MYPSRQIGCVDLRSLDEEQKRATFLSLGVKNDLYPGRLRYSGDSWKQYEKYSESTIEELIGEFRAGNSPDKSQLEGAISELYKLLVYVKCDHTGVGKGKRTIR